MIGQQNQRQCYNVLIKKYCLIETLVATDIFFYL